MERFIKELSQLDEQHLIRELASPNGIDFCSNDYLGFSFNQKIKDKIQNDFFRNSLSATSSRLIAGENLVYEEVESFIQKIYQVDSALIFGSGYLANLGILTSLGGEETCFFSDEFNHASLIDGIKLSRSKCQIFKHNDLQDLKNKLETCHYKTKVIVTESVFSMDGDTLSFNEIFLLAVQFNAFLVVDESHGTGVVGLKNLGLSNEFHQRYEKLISVHACGKSLGCYGAYVLSHKIIREIFINKARSFIYTTALPPLIVLNMKYSLEELVLNNTYSLNLKKNASFLRGKLGIPEGGPIIPFILKGNKSVLSFSSELREKGFHAKGIRYPTVPKGEERLRITAKSFHTEDQLISFAKAMNELGDL
jgi:8-amino-7-oxononanoate synthase